MRLQILHKFDIYLIKCLVSTTTKFRSWQNSSWIRPHSKQYGFQPQFDISYPISRVHPWRQVCNFFFPLPFPRFSFSIPPFLILLLLPNLLFILLLKAIAGRSSNVQLLLVASICRWVYLLYRLSKSITVLINYSFSLLTRIAISDDDYCFKTKEKNNAATTTGEHCFDLRYCHHHHHRFSEVLSIVFFSEYGMYHWLIITFHWIVTNWILSYF